MIEVNGVEKKTWQGRMTSIVKGLPQTSDLCLCYSCAKFNMHDRAKNCPIANAVYDNCVKFHLGTPVTKCMEFVHRDEFDVDKLTTTEQFIYVYQWVYGSRPLVQTTSDTILQTYGGLISARPSAISIYNKVANSVSRIASPTALLREMALFVHSIKG